MATHFEEMFATNARAKELRPGGNTLRTMGRDMSGQLLGWALQLGGVVFLGFAVGAARHRSSDGWGPTGILVLIGIGFWVVGAYHARKAQFVAWVQDAIERDREFLPISAVFVMACGKCSRLVRRDAVFCEGCANRVATPCPTCGRAVPDGSAVCSQCGEKVKK